MDNKIFNNYLQNRYQEQISYYDKNAGTNKKRYQGFQWVLIILSALTPIFAALGNDHNNFQVPVVIISAIVAILTTALKTFNYHEMWISYRNTSEMLKSEFYYYTFAVGPYADKTIERESLFVARIEGILDKEHKSWPATVKIHDDQMGTGSKAPETQADEESDANQSNGKGDDSNSDAPDTDSSKK